MTGSTPKALAPDVVCAVAELRVPVYQGDRRRRTDGHVRGVCAMKSGLVAARRDGVWMHYQVSRSLNPVIRGVVAAAVDALQQLPATTQDRKQFQRSFGQLYVLDSPAGGACCAPRAQESQP